MWRRPIAGRFEILKIIPEPIESGYRHGTEARVKSATFQPPSTDGEIARGYSDGFQLKPYSGQTNMDILAEEVRVNDILNYQLKTISVGAVCSSDTSV